MSVLVDLGMYLFLGITKDWLGLQDLSFVDKALCNQKNRKVLFNYLTRNTVMFQPVDRIPIITDSSTLDILTFKNCLQCYLHWLFDRNIGLDRLVLNGEFKDFRTHSNRLNHIEIDCFRNNNLSFFTDLLMSCVALTSLCLSHSNEVNHRLMRVIALRCKALTHIHLQQLDQLTDESMYILFADSPHVTSVRINHCRLVSDTALQSISSHCKHITALHLADCSDHITDITILNIACSYSHSLTLLDVSYLYKLSVDALQVLLERCTLITTLNLSYCHTALTDSTLLNIANNLSHLTCLNLSHGAQLTDDGLRVLTLGCTGLQTLDISDCVELTTVTANNTASNLLSFHSVTYKNCSLFKPNALLALLRPFLVVSRLDLVECVVEGRPAVTTQEVDHRKELNNTMDRAYKIKKDVINAALCKLTALTTLTISGSVGAGGVLTLISNCSLLTVMNLDDCSAVVNNKLLTAIGTHCVWLYDLSIYYCTKVTDVGILALVKRTTDLHRLNCFGCRITVDGIQTIDKYLPRLRQSDGNYRKLAQLTCKKKKV